MIFPRHLKDPTSIQKRLKISPKNLVGISALCFVSWKDLEQDCIAQYTPRKWIECSLGYPSLPSGLTYAYPGSCKYSVDHMDLDLDLRECQYSFNRGDSASSLEIDCGKSLKLSPVLLVLDNYHPVSNLPSSDIGESNINTKQVIWNLFSQHLGLSMELR